MRPIDADKFEEFIRKNCTDSLVDLWCELVRRQPTIEAVPVVHGEWIEVHEHMWRKDEDGEIDEWVWESGFHNGATCELCGYSPCVHCEPDYKTTECREVSYKCPNCGAHKKDTSSFCPECGADMRKGGAE